MELVTLGLWLLCLGLAVGRVFVSRRQPDLMQQPFPGCLFLMAVPLSLFAVGSFCNTLADYREGASPWAGVVLLAVHGIMALLCLSTMVSWAAEREARFDYGHRYGLWFAVHVALSVLFIVSIFSYYRLFF